MPINELEQYDGMGIARLIQTGEIDAQEAVHASIEQIESLNPELNAVVAKDFETALDAVKAGLPSGPLAGVPYLVKDLNTFVRGMSSTNGSRAMRDFIPKQDSILVSRLRSAGLVILGKTNTPEFGLNMCTSPALFGPTRNPFDANLSAGGSSGGSACAVASGMVPCAHATDSGGSIRIPASNCGLFGLKPSRARVPLGNDQAEGLGGFSTGHAVTHSVRDSALLLDVTAGPAEGAIYSAPSQPISFLDQLDQPFTGQRIALWDIGFAGETVHRNCQDAVQLAGTLCENIGCQVEVAFPPVDGHGLRHALNVLFSANVHNLVKNIQSGTPGVDIETLIEPITFACSEAAYRYSAADYAAAIHETHTAARVLGHFFSQYDVLLTPTLANPPLRLNELSMQGHDWHKYLERLLDEIPFTPLFNATGAPAASVPLGRSEDGLPIGVQIGTSFGDEATLLKLARALEIAAPWHHKK
jgi:Asp-tRNA(Asn)/Glu-tRNA(Gln) amidotransferase A subunit family amidase